ncbi:MAG: cellulase family glycosylhydrolase [Candidatus Doudnabacteria bacterium]|nr:cellulase family glycosylhydrolase [Candidatus Doudnabacteria bacterium]
MKKSVIVILIVIVAAILGLYWYGKPKAGPITYGVTFSVPDAQSLGLDWKQAYAATLTDLNVKLIRIPVYWDEVENSEGQYNFGDIDYMVNLAEQNHAQVILGIGKRLPRWPECHEPDWAGKLSADAQQTAQLSYMETVVNRYLDNSAVSTWQVENEPFLASFGPCPLLDENFFATEIATVKKLDPSRPILVTDSGELDWWIKASKYGDEFGTTFYRYVYSDVLKRYWTNFYFAPFVYNIKAGIMKLAHPGKPVQIAELEAEPWTTAGITSTPIDQQFGTMSLDHFKTITRLAAQTGFSPQILWGVEWWYWMKTTQGHPEFWNAAKELIK